MVNMGKNWKNHGYSRWWQLKYFLNFHPDPWGFMIQFDEYIFQMGGFNHQELTPRFLSANIRHWVGKNQFLTKQEHLCGFKHVLFPILLGEDYPIVDSFFDQGLTPPTISSGRLRKGNNWETVGPFFGSFSWKQSICPKFTMRLFVIIKLV